VFVGVLLAASTAAAQTAFVPYYGKNQIKYDNFDWQIYQTEHFEIFYYPEIEPHLERVAGYAESAYQHVSSELKHDLATKVPLILFSTSSEFFQQNVIPGAAQEGVGAFAEPSRNRILMPMDEPSDLLYRLVVHELTHVFQFDIIPTSLIRSNMPLWVMEGMSDYMTGIWRPIDLMTVRDAAVADIVPKMTELNDYGQFNNARMIYNLGHAAFEFIESRWGKEGVRQFVFSLRKTVIGGGDNAFEEAFQMDPDDWDQQFDRYLKERFKPFRDKERPADYGRDLAPNPQRTKYSSILSVEPSPSGDLVAAMTGNPRIVSSTSSSSRPRTDRSFATSPTVSTRTRASSTSPRPACASTWCRGCRGRRRAIASPTSSAPRKTGRSSCRTHSRARSRSAYR
jgi:hypothetical protein